MLTQWNVFRRPWRTEPIILFPVSVYASDSVAYYMEYIFVQVSHAVKLSHVDTQCVWYSVVWFGVGCEFLAIVTREIDILNVFVFFTGSKVHLETNCDIRGPSEYR